MDEGESVREGKQQRERERESDAGRTSESPLGLVCRAVRLHVACL